MDKINKEKVKKIIRELLIALGENPDREGLKDTPRRVSEMYEEILSGSFKKPEKHLVFYYEEEQYEEMVLIKDIPVYSMCEHHLLPFFGKAHVAYIPKKDRITGLSKLARVVEEFSRRLQLQERLTGQIADSIMNVLKPYGVIVVIEAEHFCMTMRGIRKPGSKTVTSCVRGIFQKDIKARQEVLNLISR